MKSTMKVFLVLALFCGTALADGDMGNGGLWTGTDDTKTTVTVTVNDEGGDMGNGGKTCPNGQTACLAVVPDDSELFIISYVRSLFN